MQHAAGSVSQRSLSFWKRWERQYYSMQGLAQGPLLWGRVANAAMLRPRPHHLDSWPHAKGGNVDLHDLLSSVA